MHGIGALLLLAVIGFNSAIKERFLEFGVTLLGTVESVLRSIV